MLKIKELPVSHIKLLPKKVVLVVANRYCFAQLPMDEYNRLKPGELIPERYLFLNGMNKPLYKIRKPKDKTKVKREAIE